jgi:transcriptional regulator with XRE-family HTH domain
VSTLNSEHGTWLRAQREARGWSRTDMAGRLIAAAREAGDAIAGTPENLCHSIYRWERGLTGVSAPHQRLICRVLGIGPAGFGQPADHEREPDGLQAGTGTDLQQAAGRPYAVSCEDEQAATGSGQRLTPGEHLPRDTDRMSDFGSELEHWMQERGIGVRELNRMSGYSAAYITQLRQGKRRPKADTAKDLDDALTAGGALAASVPERRRTSAVQRRTFIGLTGASVVSAMLDGVPHPHAAALAAALTDLGAIAAQEQPGDITVLAAEADGVRRHYQDCRYTRLAEDLPGLLQRLNIACSVFTGNPRDQAHALSADAHHVAASLMLKHGDLGLASLAADRSMRAALASGDPVAIAGSARIVTHALMNGGHHAAAVTTATGYATRLGRDMTSGPTPDSLSVYGSLLLRGAVAASLDDNRPTAHELLGEAEDAARRLGRDANYRWTAFGPLNATLHRISIAVTLGDAGTAIDLARGIAPGEIPVTERRATLFIDTARAYLQRGKHENAYLSIRAAHETAPEEVTARSSVRTLVRDLAATAPPSLRRDAAGFAASIGADR